jgi:hypothetical protein
LILSLSRSLAVSHPLAAAAPVLPIATALGGEGRLVFALKLFMDSVKASADPALVMLRYIQSVYCVITGIYPCTLDDAVSLACLQFQAKFGTHNPAVHKEGFLVKSLKGFVPALLLPRKAPSQWEAEVLARHAILNDDARARPADMYARILQTREYYGCAFFVVRQTAFGAEMPSHITLGITAAGVFLLDSGTKGTYRRFAFASLYRWGFKPDLSFYFELRSETPGSGPTYEFSTIEGSIMSELMTDYANQMLLEMNLEKARAEAAAKAAAEAAAKAAAAPAGAAGAPALDPRAKAARKVQSLWRGYKVRNDLHRRYAAIRVQALTRGFLARCRFDKMLEAMEREIDGGGGGAGGGKRA